MAKYQVLLLEDIINFGKKGDLATVQPGFARNYLLPQKKAVLATSATAKMRERLQQERKEQAEKDRKESMKVASHLEGLMFETVVKVDPDGHMYGSVTAAEIAEIVSRSGHVIDKKHVALMHPVRNIGNHQILLKLPEGVEVTIGLTVHPDREIRKKAMPKEEVVEPISEQTEEQV